MVDGDIREIDRHMPANSVIGHFASRSTTPTTSHYAVTELGHDLPTRSPDSSLERGESKHASM